MISKRDSIVNLIISIAYAILIGVLAVLSVYVLIDIAYIHTNLYTDEQFENGAVLYGLVTILCGIWAFLIIKNGILAYRNRKVIKEYRKYAKREMFMQSIYILFSLLTMLRRGTLFTILTAVFLVITIIYEYFSIFYTRRKGAKKKK